MVFFIDESGSINNHNPHNHYFLIAMIRTTNKKSLKRVYKRFVSSHYKTLRELDKPKYNPQTGTIVNKGGTMFRNGRFRELKGSQFDREMRKTFVEFFSRNPCFELYYVRVDNTKLTDQFCENTARVFNYTLRLALAYFIRKGLIPNEDCFLHLDERTESRYFLADYLNTELSMSGLSGGKFVAQYYDSANNPLVQVAFVSVHILSHTQNVFFL